MKNQTWKSKKKFFNSYIKLKKSNALLKKTFKSSKCRWYFKQILGFEYYEWQLPFQKLSLIIVNLWNVECMYVNVECIEF